MIVTHQSRRDMLKTASAFVAVSSVAAAGGRRATADEAKLASGAVGQIDQALSQAVDGINIDWVGRAVEAVSDQSLEVYFR